MCQQAGRRMLKQGSGSIMNIGSLASSTALGRGHIAYSMAMGAVIQMTRELSTEWAHRGVRVNCVTPAQVVNPSLQARMVDDPLLESRFLKGIPANRLGQPDDIRGIALLLASDASAWITGAIIPLDGGNVAMNAGATPGAPAGQSASAFSPQILKPPRPKNPPPPPAPHRPAIAKNTFQKQHISMLTPQLQPPHDYPARPPNHHTPHPPQKNLTTTHMKANAGGNLEPQHVYGHDHFIDHLWQTLDLQSILQSGERQLAISGCFAKCCNSPNPAGNRLHNLEKIHSSTGFAELVFNDIQQFLGTDSRKMSYSDGSNTTKPVH
jgi:hypothetical protein